MKKLLYSLIFILPISLTLFSCDKSENPNNDEESQAVDLSAKELANCYIIQEPGTYKIKADNQFNLGEGLPVPPVINPESAQLIWQTNPGSIKSVELIINEKTPYIQFEVTIASGNAIIAALDSSGKIEWSWHIWMPETEIESITSNNGYEVMNLNLGALNNNPGDPNSYGMLYQWGRKDPFPAAASLTGDLQTISAPMYDMDNNLVFISHTSWTDNVNNTLEYSIANPTVCISNYSQYSKSRDWLSESVDNLWGNPNGYNPDSGNKFPDNGKKTCYDPSPAGWRVAPPDCFSNFTSSGGYAWDFSDFNVKDVNNDGIININDYNYGWHFLLDSDKSLYFPAASRFDGSYAMLMGSMSGLWGNYWSNSPNSSISGGAFCGLSFQVKGQNGEDWISVSPAGAASRADAYSIRCIRDI